MSDTGFMTTSGRVRDWHADDGWGVIDSDATPGGCWAHFSSVLVSGHRSLEPGQQVTFTFERADQDGYAFRAIEAWPADRGPERDEAVRPDGRAVYGSTLILASDEEEQQESAD